MASKEMVQDLLSTFRSARGQQTITPEPPKKSKSKKSYSGTIPKKSPYDSFLEKYYDLENTIDSFSTSDILYFFVKKAEENGIKYIVSNHAKEMACAKRLLKNYEPREVCLMIEFLFESGQSYLDIRSISICTISSGWCNKIYNDSLLWVEDKYVEKSSSKRREWNHTEDDSIKIGEW